MRGGKRGARREWRGREGKGGAGRVSNSRVIASKVSNKEPQTA